MMFDLSKDAFIFEMQGTIQSDEETNFSSQSLTNNERPHAMTIDELKHLIKQPESEILEFKVDLRDSRQTAKFISAFANTKGGMLIVGIKEGGEISGVNDPARVEKILRRAADKITPSISFQTNQLSVDNKTVVVVQIEKGTSPLNMVDGQLFQRTGDRFTPLTSKALYASLQKSHNNLASFDDVNKNIEQLTLVIEKMNLELVKAKNWRGKLIDMIIGGLIGAIISIVFTFFLGWF
jgi:predicted HTH transcriptional regulator